MRRLPPQLDGCGSLLELEVIKHEAVGAATDEEDGLLFLAHRWPGADPGINERAFVTVIIDPKSRAVLGLHDEFVESGLFSEYAAGPAI